MACKWRDLGPDAGEDDMHPEQTEPADGSDNSRNRRVRRLGRGRRARAQASGIPLGGETRRPGSRRERQSAAGGDILAGAQSSSKVSSAVAGGVQLNVRLDAPASSP